MVVGDARPALEGRRFLSRLLAAGIPCTYVLLNALSYILSVRALHWLHRLCPSPLLLSTCSCCHSSRTHPDIRGHAQAVHYGGIEYIHARLRQSCGGEQPLTHAGPIICAQEVSKVILGASAVLSNGTVISRCGAAAVAMLAASRCGKQSSPGMHAAPWVLSVWGDAACEAA